jgi:hypothetical protein
VRRLALAAVWALACCAPGLASAQAHERLEISGGAVFLGGIAFPAVDANQVVPNGGVRPLFRTESELTNAPGYAARVGVRVSKTLVAESSITISRPSLTTHVTRDVEADPVDLSAQLTHYAIEAGVLAALARWRSGPFQPFATIGAGYRRQVSQDQTLAEDGITYYVGGGLYYLLRERHAGRLQSAGVRVDMRAGIAEAGLALDRATHVFPSVGGGVFIRF